MDSTEITPIPPRDRMRNDLVIISGIQVNDIRLPAAASFADLGNVSAGLLDANDVWPHAVPGKQQSPAECCSRYGWARYTELTGIFTGLSNGGEMTDQTLSVSPCCSKESPEERPSAP